jgi:hypothetical protein
MLPKIINVQGIPYSVEKCDNLTVNGIEMDGHVTHHNACIKVDSGMHLEVEKRTLWHEIIHAMFKAQGHSHYRSDENLIIAIENGVVQLIQDNWELVSYTVAGEPLVFEVTESLARGAGE